MQISFPAGPLPFSYLAYFCVSLLVRVATPFGLGVGVRCRGVVCWFGVGSNGMGEVFKVLTATGFGYTGVLKVTEHSIAAADRLVSPAYGA